MAQVREIAQSFGLMPHAVVLHPRGKYSSAAHKLMDPVSMAEAEEEKMSALQVAKGLWRGMGDMKHGLWGFEKALFKVTSEAKRACGQAKRSGAGEEATQQVTKDPCDDEGY